MHPFLAMNDVSARQIEDFNKTLRLNDQQQSTEIEDKAGVREDTLKMTSQPPATGPPIEDTDAEHGPAADERAPTWRSYRRKLERRMDAVIIAVAVKPKWASMERCMERPTILGHLQREAYPRCYKDEQLYMLIWRQVNGEVHRFWPFCMMNEYKIEYSLKDPVMYYRYGIYKSNYTIITFPLTNNDFNKFLPPIRYFHAPDTGYRIKITMLFEMEWTRSPDQLFLRPPQMQAAVERYKEFKDTETVVDPQTTGTRPKKSEPTAAATETPRESGAKIFKPKGPLIKGSGSSFQRKPMDKLPLRRPFQNDSFKKAPARQFPPATQRREQPPPHSPPKQIQQPPPPLQPPQQPPPVIHQPIQQQQPVLITQHPPTQMVMQPGPMVPMFQPIPLQQQYPVQQYFQSPMTHYDPMMGPQEMVPIHPEMMYQQM